MPRCRIDTTIQRHTVDGFDFPLGAYPIEPMTSRAGYTLHFESADADDTNDEAGQLEQWPDRYVFDIVIKATRVESLCRSLFSMLPGRVYPILDVLGNDAYREADPYVAYDLIGQEHFTEALRRYRGWFYEDGLVGFGVMSDEPFIYIFIDEHKIVTVRVEASLKPKVESILAAFDLHEVDQIAGADAALHEHRGVLDCPTDRPDLLCPEEIIEELRDSWGLQLNIDVDRNLDEFGNALGFTPWRCLVRVLESPSAEIRYAEVFLIADCYSAAVRQACEAVEDLIEDEEQAAIEADRSGGRMKDRRADRPKRNRSGDDAEKTRQAASGSPSDEPDPFDELENDPIPLDDLGNDLDDIPDVDALFCDRVTEADFEDAVPDGRGKNAPLNAERVIFTRWLE
jgi:hypothetical protein